jgi:hypothetical protein
MSSAFIILYQDIMHLDDGEKILNSDQSVSLCSFSHTKLHIAHV